MPCDYVQREGQTEAERKAEVNTALARLERALATKTVKPVIGRQGAVALSGWRKEERAGLSDVCALRKLRAKGSSALRLALVKAEAQAGRRVSWQAVGSGIHSHDGGRTWAPGH